MFIKTVELLKTQGTTCGMTWNNLAHLTSFMVQQVNDLIK